MTGPDTTVHSRIMISLFSFLLLPAAFALSGCLGTTGPVQGHIIWDKPWKSRFDGELKDGRLASGVLYFDADASATRLGAFERYEGPFMNGMPIPQGTYFYRSGTTWQGQYAPLKWNAGSARPNGAGVMTMQDGTVYRGNVVSNALHPDMSGEAEVRWPAEDVYGRVSYQGFIDNFLPHGRGTMTWQDRHYTGDFSWGKPHGSGTMTFTSGRKLSGNWRYGAHAVSGWHPRQLDSMSATRTANGLRWPGGGAYEGKLSAGRPHGRGTMVWASGDRYEGEWRNGRRDGRGVQTNLDGSSYAGDWKDDREEGFGRAEWKMAMPKRSYPSSYVGYWEAGMPQGRGERSWAWGDMSSWMTGPFLPEKEFLHQLMMEYLEMSEWDEDGLESAYSYSGLWRDGRFHGEGMFNHDIYDTKVYAQFVDGRLEGQVNAASRIGDNKWSFFIRDGKLEGEWMSDRGPFVQVRQYRNNEIVPGSEQHLRREDKSKQESDGGFFGVLAGAAMFAGLKSVGADSATALEGAMAFGQDAENKTVSNSQAFTAGQEQKYLALKRENDAQLQRMLANNQRLVDEERQRANAGLPARSTASGAAGVPPAAAVAASPSLGLAPRDTSTTTTGFDPKWFGTYRSNLCPETCYWQINEGGIGEWSAEFGYGEHAHTIKTPIRWEVIGRVSNAQEAGFMLRVIYQNDLPDELIKSMKHDAQARNDNQLRVYGSATDSRCCYAQFYGRLNSFYGKE